MALTREKFVEFAMRNGWAADSHKHYQKVMKYKRYRLKMGERSVRYEVKTTDGRWVLLASNYYSRLKVETVGGVERLAGLVLGKRTGEA